MFTHRGLSVQKYFVVKLKKNKCSCATKLGPKYGLKSKSMWSQYQCDILWFIKDVFCSTFDPTNMGNVFQNKYEDKSDAIGEAETNCPNSIFNKSRIVIEVNQTWIHWSAAHISKFGHIIRQTKRRLLKKNRKSGLLAQIRLTTFFIALTLSQAASDTTLQKSLKKFSLMSI